MPSGTSGAPQPEQRACAWKRSAIGPHQHRDEHAVLHLLAEAPELDLAGPEAE
jgi:hypothetical protein